MCAKVQSLEDLYKLVPGSSPPAERENPPEPDRTAGLVKLHVQLERKGRKGKGVTVIMGFHHSPADLKEFARQLKTLCGSGGTVKEQTIEIQGDHRGTAAEFFRSKGFRVTGA